MMSCIKTDSINYSYLLNSEELGLGNTAKEPGLATFCVNYLYLSIFNSPFSTHPVLDGNYGFMEYAVINWVRHLESGLSSKTELDEWM
jgi:hypothetical protein